MDTRHGRDHGRSNSRVRYFLSDICFFFVPHLGLVGTGTICSCTLRPRTFHPCTIRPVRHIRHFCIPTRFIPKNVGGHFVRGRNTGTYRPCTDYGGEPTMYYCRTSPCKEWKAQLVNRTIKVNINQCIFFSNICIVLKPK